MTLCFLGEHTTLPGELAAAKKHTQKLRRHHRRRSPSLLSYHKTQQYHDEERRRDLQLPAPTLAATQQFHQTKNGDCDNLAFMDEVKRKPKRRGRKKM